MTESLRRSLAWIIDIAALIVGGAALVCGLLSTNKWHCSVLCGIAGIACVCYIAYALILWFLRRPKFDWHLVNGHFLRKVCCLVLLIPSLLTFVASHWIYSSKQLVFEDNLYVSAECCQDTVVGAFLSVNDSVCHESSVLLYRTVDKKLPDSIAQAQEDPSIYWSVYYHFIDPGNQHMTTTKLGRFWAALIGVFGVFLLNGLLVSSIIGYVDRRKEKWQKGEIRYKWFLKSKCHYVVIGGNDMVVGIVRQILAKIYEDKRFGAKFTRPYILIQTSRDVESFRRELFSELTEKEQKRIVVYYGNRNSIVDIRELRLMKAKEVYILGENIRTDDMESYHDTMNMECLKLLSQDIEDVKRFAKKENKDSRLVCRVMFEYQTSFNILQTTDVDSNKIKFLPFNYYEMWAQNVLICQELTSKDKCLYLPLEGFEGIKSTEDSFVHLVIVGMSRMGVAMAIEAAHLAHFPNYETKKIRTKITFIDKNAAEEMNFFKGRFKELFTLSNWRYDHAGDYLVWKKTYTPHGFDYLGGDFIDIEWEFISGSVEHPAVQQYLSTSALNRNAKLTIAICLPENSRSIAAACYLPDDVYKSNSTQQVLVYQRLNDDLLIQINNNKRYCKKLRAFGMARECYNSSLVELSECVAKDIGIQYNQYMWNKLKERYLGKGLIDDDYDYLTGWKYSNSEDDVKAEMRCLCDEWIKGHHHIELYSEVKEAREVFEKKYQEKKVGKSKAAKMWSNQYNIYSMWTKYRCTSTDDKHIFNPMLNDEFGDIQIGELGKMEHNRWVVEQLLLRYRPLTREEQREAVIGDLYASSTKKNAYKSIYAHLDICSNDKLDGIDYNISQLDEELIRILPKSYRAYCNINKS